MTPRAAVPPGPEYAPHARAERLIATGRLVLAVASLAAVYLEPSTPARYQQATYALLSVYTVYAIVITAITWRSPVPSAKWRLFSHAADLFLFSIFVSMTEGPASPFFLYFVFSLFCATLRFSWRGILATGAAAIAVYAGLAWIASFTDPGFEVSRVLIRVTYLGVITALLVYLGLYQQQLRSELAGLAAWPRDFAAERDRVLHSALAHAAAVMRVPKLVLIWEEHEEPWLYAATHDGSDLRVERFAPDGEISAAREATSDRTVFLRSRAERTLVYEPARQSVVELADEPPDAAFRRRFGIESGIVVTLAGEALDAKFVVPDLRAATGDDLALAHIAGRMVLSTLEQFFFLQQVRQAASAEERLRISRDLHDGVVQSLAGVGLALQTIRDRISDEGVATQLAHVQNVVEQDQRDLRSIVRELRLHDARHGWSILADELQRMRERFPLEWGLEVRVDAPGAMDLSPRLARELCRIVNESLSNAARHGAATRTDVLVSSNVHGIEMRIADNGRGFRFVGHQELEELERNGEGPRTLKERVRKLGGRLAITSSAHGATLVFRIPIGQEPA